MSGRVPLCCQLRSFILVPSRQQLSRQRHKTHLFLVAGFPGDRRTLETKKRQSKNRSNRETASFKPPVTRSRHINTQTLRRNSLQQYTGVEIPATFKSYLRCTVRRWLNTFRVTTMYVSIPSTVSLYMPRNCGSRVLPWHSTINYG